MNKKSVMLLCAVLLTSPVALARNDMMMLPIKDVFKMKKTKEILGEDIKLYFADQAPEGALEPPLGDVQVEGKGDAYTQHSQTSKRDDETMCRDAMRNALSKLVADARARHGDAVIKIVSAYNGVVNASPTAYECHAGNTKAVVQLKGVVVKFAK